jgi:hypothetical protein
MFGLFHYRGPKNVGLKFGGERKGTKTFDLKGRRRKNPAEALAKGG